MTISLPSKRIPVVNAPEVENFKSEFVYNFFLKDEKTNETGITPYYIINNNPSERYDTAFIESRNFKNKVPRYAKLTWKPVIKNQQNSPIDKMYYDKYIAQKISIKNNYSKIQYENNFVEKDFMNLIIQDSGIDQKLSFFVRRALDQLNENMGDKQESYLDVAKVLNSLTSEEVGANFLAQALFDLKSSGVSFIDKTNKEKVINSIIKKIQETKINIKLNNKILKQIATSAAENINSIYQDEIQKILNDFEIIQNHSIETNDSSLLNENDYDFEVENYISARNVDSNFDSFMVPIGYVIEKYEFLDNGTKILKQPIIIENPYTSVYADLNIKYDSRYFYSIRSIVYVETSAIEQDTGDIIALSFLISSQPSSEISIRCSEMVPPPAPTDFNFTWEHRTEGLLLNWSFPPNSQRDIKYFQVFRRKTIYEPFELIKMYDFDDSEILSDFNEEPEDWLVETLQSPKTYYYDKEFNKDSKYIYSLCSIDAHGMSSPYSMQFEISFDKFKNKIVKKLISVAGAPKPYPNMFLNQDTFVDVIKDSNHKKMKVYFNPEYLEIFDNNNSNLNLLKTDKDSYYKIQMINVDLQKEQDVYITLDDKRTTTQKNKLNNGTKLI